VERFLIFYRKYRYFSFGKPVYFNGYFGQFTGITGLPVTGIAIPKGYEFIDFKAAYDTIIRNEVYVGMSELNFPTNKETFPSVTHRSASNFAHRLGMP
jgi:hypothetical protein